MQASSRVQKLCPHSQPLVPQPHTHRSLWALVPSAELVKLPACALCDFSDNHLSGSPRSLFSRPHAIDAADLTASYGCRGSGPLRPPYMQGTSRQEEERSAGCC